MKIPRNRAVELADARIGTTPAHATMVPGAFAFVLIKERVLLARGAIFKLPFIRCNTNAHLTV